jgi:hypothetical protein
MLNIHVAVDINRGDPALNDGVLQCMARALNWYCPKEDGSYSTVEVTIRPDYGLHTKDLIMHIADESGRPIITLGAIYRGLETGYTFHS